MKKNKKILLSIAFGIVILSICIFSNMVTVFADSNYQDEEAGKENSWRYEDGVLNVKESASSSKRMMRSANQNAAIARGIDVSEHNGKIDWEKVKSSGIDFAIIRCGYGMDLPKQDDKYWQYNVTECERLGIPYGVYIYSYADSTDRAASEADHVLRLLKGHTPSYPVYYDLEESRLESTNNRALLAKMAKVFCNKVSSVGYPVGIYANLNWWNNYLTDPIFDNSNWDKWVAQYHSSCTYAKDFHLWQYTSKGSVNGISGRVDMNYEYGKKPKPQISSMKNGSVILTWPKVSGAIKYAIAMKTDDGYQTYTLDCNENKYAISGLENGKTYYFLVQAYINNKWTPFTSNDLVECFFIESPNVTVPTVGDGSVTLSWDKVEGATKYAIAEYIDGGYKTYTLDCKETKYTIEDLANNYTHKFLVQANVGGKWSLCSTDLLISATPKGRVKPAPQVTASGNTVSLKWDKVPGATKYAIAQKTTNGYKTYTLNCTKLNYKISGLDVGKRYQFLVQAYINGKWSKFSDADLVDIMITDSTSPKVKVEATGDGSVTLSWDKVEGATKYAIAEYIDGGYKTYTLDCKETKYTIEDLANNYTHKFLVQANVGGKWSLCSTDLLVSVRL